jgi:Spy/CpxP family protein refolding chaperone
MKRSNDEVEREKHDSDSTAVDSAAGARCASYGALVFAAVLVGGLAATDAVAFSRHGEHDSHYARHGEDGDRAGRGPRALAEGLERHAEKLGISDETVAKMQSIAATARAAEESDRSELEDLREEIRELVDGDSVETVNSDAIMALLDEAGALETAAKKRRLHALLEMRALLTVEQREQLAELREKKLRAHYRGGSRTRW